MNILVSNDDGFHALGIQILTKTLREAGHKVVVFAPDRNRSAASSCLTLTDPLRVHGFDDENFAVIAGTPADCVHLALNGYFDQPFDLVISGINHGANLGDDVVYSGTVAAALEGRHLRLPSIAVSLVERKGSRLLSTESHFATAAQVTLDVLAKIEQNLLPARQILNINVPNLPYEQVAGMQVTRLGHRSPAAEIVKAQDPRGANIFWIGVNGQAVDDGQGTDFHAINHNYVSITPIQADMTAHQSLQQLSEQLL
ncbi:5'/3'-nucleotidase SurE [Pasteurellaceae bacterium RH1A]|nr:5'/3'-nucleotidase SurE [Pasteurellaceae bacterium RH1A]